MAKRSGAAKIAKTTGKSKTQQPKVSGNKLDKTGGLVKPGPSKLKPRNQGK